MEWTFLIVLGACTLVIFSVPLVYWICKKITGNDEEVYLNEMYAYTFFNKPKDENESEDKQTNIEKYT